MEIITKLEKVKELINENQFAFLYVSSTGCNVCKGLLPKIESLLSNFPNVNSAFVESSDIPELASEFSIFAVPTMILFIEGNEFFRESRYVSTEQLYLKMSKYYSMFFEEA